MKNHLLILLVCCLSSLTNAQIVSKSILTNNILTLDSLLFNIGFNECNEGVFESLLSNDFEFYHDKSGFSNKTKFLSDMKNGLCADQTLFRSRRALLPESTVVTGLYDGEQLYGAIQEGAHLFYEQMEGAPEKLVGSARFTHVWLIEDGEWKLKRSLSFEHAPVKTEEKIHNE